MPFVPHFRIDILSSPVIIGNIVCATQQLCVHTDGKCKQLEITFVIVIAAAAAAATIV